MTTRIYVIDENPLAGAELVTRIAEATGWETRAFSSLRAARRTSDEPSSDGLVSTLEQLEAGTAPDATGDAAVIALVREADPDALARATERVGVLRVVTRPVVLEELLPKLSDALERRTLMRELAATRAALAKQSRALDASKRETETATEELVNAHSELETATERLVEAEQLAAVGRVVTGIAHELERQLALVGYAEAIKSRVSEDPELAEFADIIVTAQKRLSVMVHEIRDFVLWEETDRCLEREPADVASAVDEALALLAFDPDVRQREIVRDFRQRPLASLHRQKFSQVVINLISNAVLATEPGQSIHILLDTVGRDVILTVKDPGVGMTRETLARLGEPFFTTRGDRGSGLGVGICMRIVEEHGGELTFESTEGIGTTARVRVPLIEDDT